METTKDTVVDRVDNMRIHLKADAARYHRGEIDAYQLSQCLLLTADAIRDLSDDVVADHETAIA